MSKSSRRATIMLDDTVKHRSIPGQSIVVPADAGTQAWTNIVHADTGEVISLWLPVVAWTIKSGASKWPVTLPASRNLLMYPTVEYPNGLIETGCGDIFRDRAAWASHQEKEANAA